jgi:hypothetical protein
LISGDTNIRGHNTYFSPSTVRNDPLGRRSTITRGNGGTTSQTYAWGGLVNNLQQSLTGGSNVMFTLGYDPSGGLVTRQVSNTAYLWHGRAASTAYTVRAQAASRSRKSACGRVLRD